ncbi:MAG: hypothetical protein DRP74_06020 [Candidatus Omnitrophota bacterium]|nr:MAG: hypothetical protein DRP74_06020 [Candidatus Omnitrophota bacterium]
MKRFSVKVHLLFFIIYIFYLFLPKISAAVDLPFLDTDILISMDFKDANLKDILKIFSMQSGLNFIASESVQDRKVTLYLDNVPIEEAMNKIFKANNLTYELEKDSNIFIVKDWGRPQVETVTKVFYLKHATVSSSFMNEEIDLFMERDSGGREKTTEGIRIAVEKIISEYGRVSEDPRTNSLIVTDLPSRMPVIAETIAALDKPVPQVMLEIEMLDVSKDLTDQMGFEFGANAFTLLIPGSRGSQFFMGDITKRGQTMTNTSSAAGVFTFGRTYAEVLDFLHTQTDVKSLARPRVLALNNQTAEIKITANEAIGVETTATSDTGTTTADVERTETGVSLRITPQINTETGEITMFIFPKVSEASTGSAFTSGDETYQFRDPEERSTKSLIRVKDNETVILGGLIRTEFNQVITKVPILGDIPIIGALFRHKNKSKDKERELLVFITPHIIKDTDIQFTEAARSAFPVREQNSVSQFDRQLEISATLNNLENIR